MNDTLEEFKRQHIVNYKNAVLENIKNNTNVLVEEDILSLLKKPPLDSMDVIKTKFLDLAKKNAVILNTSELDNILDDYRCELISCCDTIKKCRIDELSSKVNNISDDISNDIIKLNKKDFIVVNKKNKKFIKDHIKSSIEKKIVNNVNKIFTENTPIDLQKKISKEAIKFVSGAYQRQLLENIDIKILVKDTTLINGVREQSDRYLFTLSNSRIFKQDTNLE